MRLLTQPETYFSVRDECFIVLTASYEAVSMDLQMLSKFMMMMKRGKQVSVSAQSTAFDSTRKTYYLFLGDVFTFE